VAAELTVMQAALALRWSAIRWVAVRSTNLLMTSSSEITL